MTPQWHLLPCTGTPTPRHETSFVECRGKFYLIGGREAEGRIDEFDPDTQTWRTMAAQAPLIHHFQPVVHNDQIFMVGAMTGEYPAEPPLARIQIYTPATDTWSEGSDIPAERRRGSAGTVCYTMARSTWWGAFSWATCRAQWAG